VRGLVRKLVTTAAGLMVLVGGLGLLLHYGPEAATERVRPGVEGALAAVIGLVPGDLPRGLPERILTALSDSPLRLVLAPVGLVVLIASLLPGRARESEVEEGDDRFSEPEVGDKALRKTKKQAAAIAKKGVPIEAAELCFAVGLLEEAAGYFVDAGELLRAAEIRHDQNRFLESADLYAKAGSHDSAASIYAQQNEHGRAAEAYAHIGSFSLAAESFERAGDHRRAAECFEKAEFPRDAAKAYGRCEQWLKAARCLEREIVDMGSLGAGQNPEKEADLQNLYRATGGFYEMAGELERAEAILMKGELFVPAGEIALKRGEGERAVDLFVKAKQPERAARVLEKLGRTQEAARILAECHRDRGEDAQAAEQYERAGELGEAGDLYRMLERYAEAGDCYERAGDPAQAAEMFRSANDRLRAAANHERAGQFAEAAECFALEGDATREADLLLKAGECLRAGRIEFEAGRQDEAIRALQQVDPGHSDFAAASALLGEIFRERKMYPVAIAKLQDAIGTADLDRENLRAHYCLATVLEVSGEPAEATALYEKILAFDYHYEDVEQRLSATRDAVVASRAEPVAVRSPGESGSPARYTIRGTLGRGGMGIVYKAYDTVLDRPVAFKVLPDALQENPQALQNFLREAKSAAKLNHPNIVTVYDAGEQDGVFYIAMEYVDGNTLKDIIKRRGRIAPRGIVHVLSQMAEALSYAHEKKIVHRDIKTANTMWTVERKAKIMDFGLAKAIEEVRNHTTVVSGTPYYMSPEQTLGKNVDHRTDIYSLGVSLFEMATGTLPFMDGNIPYHHVHTAPPDPRSIAPDLPPLLVGIITRCLSKKPAERYQSAREILAELRATLDA
jgi:tetratricopeptide (TPR) repeat protein